MSTAKVHGTAFIFGIDGAYLGSYAQITSISLSKADLINEFVENSNGQIASSLHDDEIHTLDATIRFTSSFSRPTISAKMTLAATAQFDGDYMVENWTETKTAKGFVEGKITLVKRENLTLS